MCNLGTAGSITSHPLLAAGLTICHETPIYYLDMQCGIWILCCKTGAHVWTLKGPLNMVWIPGTYAWAIEGTTVSAFVITSYYLVALDITFKNILLEK
jgi:hypothetical protein